MTTPHMDDPMAEDDLPEPTMEQKLDLIMLQLEEERRARQALQAQLTKLQGASTDKEEPQAEDLIRRTIDATLEAQTIRKESKISKRSFKFRTFNGIREGKTVLSFISQFDDYFHEETYPEKDKIKCVTNHLIDRASLWWTVVRKSIECPATWEDFKKKFMQNFLPPQFHEKAIKQWDLLQQRDREPIPQYTERFWNALLQLRMLEDVPETTHKRKYMSGLLGHYYAEVNMFKPATLEDAISLAHDTEDKLRGRDRRPQPFQANGNYGSKQFNSNFRRFNPGRFSSPSFRKNWPKPPALPSTVNPNPKPIQQANPNIPRLPAIANNVTKAKPIVCYKCHQPGHLAANCHSKKPSAHINYLGAMDEDEHEDMSDFTEEEDDPTTTSDTLPVVLRELFHNLPVRRKSIQSRKVLQGVKERTMRLALIRPDVSLTVFDLERLEKLIHTTPCLSSLDMLSEFFGQWVYQELQEVNLTKKNLKLHGFVSKKSSTLPSSKVIHFFYLNGRFVHKTPVHKLIKTCFLATNEVAQLATNEVAQSSSKVVSLPEMKSWMLGCPSKLTSPAFLMELRCPLSWYDITFEPAKTSVEFKNWNLILSLVREALDIVWGMSLASDGGGTNCLSHKEPRNPHNPRVRKRKPWQLTDPTYHPKSKIKVADTLDDFFAPDAAEKGVDLKRSVEIEDLLFNIPNGYRSPHSKRSYKSWSYGAGQDVDLKRTMGIEELLFNTPKGQRTPHKKRKSYGSPSQQHCLLSPSWILQHCTGEGADHTTDLTWLRNRKAKDKRTVPEGECDILDSWATETKFLSPSFEKTNIESRENQSQKKESEMMFERDYLSETEPFRPLYTSTSNSNMLSSNLSRPMTTDDMLWEPQSMQLQSLDFLEECNQLKGNALTSFSKPLSKLHSSTRRRLYELDFVLPDTDDFFFHSERQAVNNFNFRQGADILEPVSRHRNPEWTTTFAHGWQQTHVNGELDKSEEHGVDKFCALAPKESLSLNEMPLCALPAFSPFKGIDSLGPDPDSASTKPNYHDVLGEQKHADVNSPAIKNPKHIITRSLSCPPFYKRRRKYALYPAHMHSSAKECQIEINSRKVFKSDTAKHAPSAVEDLPTDVGCSSGSQKRVLQDGSFVPPMSSPDSLPGNEGLEICKSNCKNGAIISLGDDRQADPTAMQLYKEWRNPCMRHSEPNIIDLSSAFLGPFNKHLLPESISKEKFQFARVLQQVGKKFITTVAQDILVVIDQHAADERVRLEQLRKEVLEEESHLSALLDYAQEVSISMGDQQLLQTYRTQIEEWGWRFRTFPFDFKCTSRRNEDTHVGNAVAVVTAVPKILGESLIGSKHLLEYLRQLSKTDGTSAPPPPVLRILASKACRGAIMFGDHLLRSECQQLVEALKQTALCFQCAHGRPTLIPLVNMEALRQRLRRLPSKIENIPGASNELSLISSPSPAQAKERASIHPRVSWHGLKWYRPTLARARERHKLAAGM